MGLMFVTPKDEKETDRVSVINKEVTLKSYGLPMIFWGYLAAILTVILAMSLAIKEPVVRLYETGDSINKTLAISVIITIVGLVTFLLCFYFYEKFISKKGDQLRLTHRVFWIPVVNFKYELENNSSFEVKHFMDSPNVARMRGEQSLKGFENRGYFQLFAKCKDGREILVDRSSQKKDLVKTMELLNRY